MKNLSKKIGILFLILGLFGGVAYDSHLAFTPQKKAEASYFQTLPSTPHWVKVEKTFNDWSAASLTSTITIYTPASNEVVTGIAMYIPTAFTGGIISAYSFQVNWGSQPMLVAVNALTPTVNATGFNSSASAILGNADAGGRTMTMAATSVTGLLNTATTGVVDIYFLVSQTP